MEEKLVKVLLSQYKEKGIDLYALLDDHFFQNLKLEQKVDLIKKYASHISSGTSRTLTKKDISALVFDAAFSGVLTSITAGLAARHAGKYFAKGLVPVGAIAGAAVLGAGLSAGASYLNGRKHIKNRNDILDRIDATVKNPTDENALSVLTTRNNQTNPIARTSVNSSAAAHINSAAKRVPAVIMDQVDPVINYLSHKHNWENQESPYAPGVDIDVVEEAYRRSADSMKNSFENSIHNMKHTILGRN